MKHNFKMLKLGLPFSHRRFFFIFGLPTSGLPFSVRPLAVHSKKEEETRSVHMSTAILLTHNVFGPASGERRCVTIELCVVRRNVIRQSMQCIGHR